MMSGRISCVPAENPLGMSWHDSNWIPILNSSNIMDYFSERGNPFYDRTCNNEIVKMQRLSLDQLNNMTGLEYCLLHVQEPILYVIRKQHRHGPGQTVPLANYYIIAGTVYQAPDLSSLFNSRIISAIHFLQSAFEESLSYARYHPSKGYTWDLKNSNLPSFNEKSQTKELQAKEEPSSLFQKHRVDLLLVELTKKFPLNSNPITHPNKTIPNEIEIKQEIREPKIEKESDSPAVKPPPEKKPRIT